MSRKLKDYFSLTTIIALSSTLIGSTSGGLVFLLRENKKENENQERILSNMRALADSSQLHPDYGNNNHLFDSTEISGVARDLGIILDMNRKISYNYALRYVQMYAK